ncbi:MAG: hypothetical protein EOO27_41470, partial [Comamonadaceae bacterium]
MYSLLLLAVACLSLDVHASARGGPATVAEVYAIVDRAEYLAGSHVSSTAALNPCVEARTVFGEAEASPDWKIFEDARRLLPPRACSSAAFTLLARRLFALQSLALTSTDRPVELDAAILANRAQLARCNTPECGIDVMTAAMPFFAESWQKGLLTTGAQRRLPLGKSTTIRSPAKWLKNHSPRMLVSMRALCFDEPIQANIQPGYGTDRIVQVWCAGGGGNSVESPFGMLISRGAGWREMLKSDSVIQIEVLPVVRHGYPDLKAPKRISMGESSVDVYAFNGREYENVLWLDIQ